MDTVERQKMDADIVCVGFGPATAGFLTTLSRAMVKPDGSPALESTVAPGMPLQVLAYERADDIGFGVSGVVTAGRAIRASFPGKDLPSLIPNAAPVGEERVAYLFDPIGASRRTAGTKFVDRFFRAGSFAMKKGPAAVELPWIPPFLRKDGGMVLSMGQFLSWVGAELMGGGLVQIWPGSPVAAPLFEGEKVTGVRLADQGVTKKGAPDGAAYMPGMDVSARLTVVGDGPVGAVGRKLDAHFGLPKGHAQHDWAVGMKAVVALPADCPLQPGAVIHTLGYPEPEIFGFLYVYPDRTASLGIFVPSWFDSPVRTSYRYLQHWMQHPYLWQYLKGATLQSWGAKSLQESGLAGEPFLAGDGFARVGEGSGSTNCLTNSGVDEAWRTGVILAEGVIDTLKKNPKAVFDRATLDAAYVARRRADPLARELKAAAHAREGFQKSFFLGMMGEGMAGMTRGILHLNCASVPPSRRIKPLESLCSKRLSRDTLNALVADAAKNKKSLHDAVMNIAGWPEIPFDGTLLMSHQDVLLKGGKVQAAGGFADHVGFADPKLCAECTERTCIEMCSAQALSPGEEGGTPAFDREKCIHCGACIWSCSRALPGDPEQANIVFSAGSGGLHSSQN